MTTTRYESLFDTRGGLLQATVCESCGDAIEDDAISPVCAECHTEVEPE